MPPSTLLTIPPELLLNTISHLPTSNDFLSLVQTSHGLKSFFAQHAAQICNTHITKHYALEAAVMRSQLIQGQDGGNWLAPTMPSIHRPEYNRRHFALRHSKLPENPELFQKLGLAVPGPQFLRFLEACHLDIRIWMQVESGDEGERNVGERFEWALDTYTVSRFANMVGDFVMGFEEGRDVGVIRMGRTVKGKVVGFKKEVMERKWGGERASLLFGEIEKVEGQEIEKKESFVKGLLWYYGRSGVAPLDSTTEKVIKVSFIMNKWSTGSY
jgi:hypothetical protein